MCAAPVLHTSAPTRFLPALCHQQPLQVRVFLLFLHISLRFQSSGLHQAAIVRAREEKRENRWGRGALGTRLSASDDALPPSAAAVAAFDLPAKDVAETASLAALLQKTKKKESMGVTGRGSSYNHGCKQSQVVSTAVRPRLLRYDTQVLPHQILKPF